jgi:hypothetical protein
LTGQNIDTIGALSWTNTKEYHHFFPQDYLKQKGVSGGKINCLANIIMLTSASNKIISNRAPSDYLKDVEAAAGANLINWLNKNLISKEAYEAARTDDYESFLDLRSKLIHEELLKKANW